MEPLAVLRDKTNRPALVACGSRDKKAVADWFVATSINVFHCGSSKSFWSLEGDSDQRYIVEASRDRFVITETEKWPFGPRWKWIDVPVRRYVIAADRPDHVVESSVLKAPLLTRREIGDALNYYTRHIQSPAFEDDYENVIGRVLAAAITGNGAARRALMEMPSTLELDGDAAEVYQGAVQLYNSVTVPEKRLPGLTNPTGVEKAPAPDPVDGFIEVEQNSAQQGPVAAIKWSPARVSPLGLETLRGVFRDAMTRRQEHDEPERESGQIPGGAPGCISPDFRVTFRNAYGSDSGTLNLTCGWFEGGSRIGMLVFSEKEKAALKSALMPSRATP